MSRTKSQAIADAVAKRIMANTRKHWRTLHADALEDLSMSDNLSNNAAPLRKNAVGTPADGKKMPSDGTSYAVGSQVTVGPIKPVDSKTLEGSYPGDHRANGAQPNPLAGNDKPVRGATNDELEGVGG